MIKTPNLVEYMSLNGNLLNQNGTAKVVSGSAVYATGLRGQCFNCGNGANAIDVLNLGALYNTGVNGTTLCAWLYGNESMPTTQIFPMCISNAGWVGVFYTISNNLYFVINQTGSPSQYVLSFTGFTKQVWRHVAITYKTGQIIKMYVNGELVAQSSGNLTTPAYGAAPQDTAHVTIGGRWDNSAMRATLRWYGLVEDFHYYNRQLDITDIKRIMVGLHPLRRA